MTDLLSVEKAWERLKIHLEWADRFWLLYVFTDDPRVVDMLRSRAQAELLAAGRPFEDLRPKSTTRTDVLEVLEVLLEGRDDGVAWVDFVRHDAPGSTAWHDAWQYACMQLNQRRELLRRVWSKGGIVLATTLDRLDETPGMAPDLWTIRSLLLRVATLPAERDASLSTEPLGSRAEPTRDPELARQAVDRARRALETAPSDPALANLARVLDTYGASLGSLGRRVEALAPSLEAVDILRKVVEASPDAFLPDLAKALNNLGIRLSSLGRREEAMAASLEAVHYSRKPAASLDASPDAFLPDLARALNNLGADLSSLGRREEAMAASLEAVQIRRKLAEANPDAFLPDLATALNNLSAMLSSFGRREEAMAASLEAVQHFRKVAEANSDAGLPNLAAALNNFGADLGLLGRREEALAATLEALQHYRKLAEASPDAFLPDLARALTNLGATLSSLGRREEAMAASLEAVQHFWKLAEASPDAFLPDLAQALDNLGEDLASLGQHRTARDSCAEGLRLILPYFLTLPVAHAATTTRLARQLRRLEDDHGVAIPEPLAPAVALILDVAANEPPTWSQADLDRLSQLLPSPAIENR